MLQDFSVRRLHRIPVSPGSSDPRKKLVFLSELASMGYALENPEAYSDSVWEEYVPLLHTLRQMRGGDVEYVPLFQGFPSQVPEENEYFLRRVVGFWCDHPLMLAGRAETVRSLLFDLREFGADPITQRQIASLFKAGVEQQQARQGDEHTEWVSLRLAEPAEVEEAARDFLRANLYSRSSIQETLRPDMELLLRRFPPQDIDPTQVVFKETRTYLMKYFWERGERESLAGYCQTPTDLLRLFAALTEGDVSLCKPIRYPRLGRVERRFVLRCLECCRNLAEDLQAYRGLWLALGRGLHPGAHSGQFPRVAEAFAQLRRGRMPTFASQVEKALREKNSEAACRLLRSRPGLFARRLHQLLELAGPDYARVLEEFAPLAPQIPLKNLLVMQSYFQTIESLPYRTIINKQGRILVMPNRPFRIAAGPEEQLLELLESSILSKIRSQFSSWEGKRVWIDERLRRYTIPLQLRKASEGLLVLGRGTRLPLALEHVLRLFVYWKDGTKTTDLDLSLIQFGAELEYLGHVSYTHLAAAGIVHSGDLQSAPHGAAEFIDVDLAYLKKNHKRCRYLAPLVFRYRGDRFSDMQCHAGWMVRDKIDANYQTFDIKTVQNKFDLSANSSYAIPILVDVWAGELVYVDLYVSAVEQYNRVEGAVGDISIITGEMMRMLKTRPNLLALAEYHLRGRGASACENRQEADITFGLEGCDYSVQRMEGILSDLL